VQIALNYYSQWLFNSCGEYPAAVFDDVRRRTGNIVLRYDDNMYQSVPLLFPIVQRSPLANPDFFEVRESKAVGARLRTPKPVLAFPGGEVELRFNVGARGNGVDRPVWPTDLLTEVIA